MENKLFIVTYNILTKELDVHPSPEGTIADHTNILHFTNYPDFLMHVYADDEKKALEIARIDIRAQLRALSGNIDKAIEEKISEKVYVIGYNVFRSDIEYSYEADASIITNTNCIDKVRLVGLDTSEVIVTSQCKREAKNKALDLISEYFSDKAKKAADRKKVMEEFDDED